MSRRACAKRFSSRVLTDIIVVLVTTTMSSDNNLLPLFSLIPSDQSITQTASDFTDAAVDHVYTLQRQPVNIDELDRFKNIAVLMSTGSLTFINVTYKGDYHYQQYRDKTNHPLYYARKNRTNLSMTFDYDESNTPSISIFGPTDESILESAVYFAKLIPGSMKAASVSIDCHDDFSCDLSDLLQHVFACASNPPRSIKICTNSLTSEAAAIIASQPYVVDLNLHLSRFDDGGNKFVDGLSDRQCCFGSLSVCYSALSDYNKDRLFTNHLSLFKRLSVPGISSDHIVKALAAPLERIDFHVPDDSSFSDNIEANLSTVDIRLHEAVVYVNTAQDEFPERFLLSFFRRAAHSLCLERLALLIYGLYPIPMVIQTELIKMLRTTEQLTVLNLGGLFLELDSSIQRELFACLEDHPSVQTLFFREYPVDADPGYTWLQNLIKRNRFIEVIDMHDKPCTDGDKVDALYAFNDFFFDSEYLQEELPATRLPLVIEALSQYAADDLQRTALLVAHHVDVLCSALFQT